MKPTNASRLLPGKRSYLVQAKKLEISAQRRQLTGLCWGLSLALIASLGIIRSAHADTEKYQADIFLPNSLFFTGQQSKTLNQNAWLANLGRGLDNEALLQIANNLRANNMSSAQRELNYQWLGQQYNKDLEFDGDAVSALLKLGLQTLWDQIKLSNIESLPDTSGRGTLNFKEHSFDYILKISKGDLGVTFNYNF